MTKVARRQAASASLTEIRQGRGHGDDSGLPDVVQAVSRNEPVAETTAGTGSVRTPLVHSCDTDLRDRRSAPRQVTP